jgi:hypothetical protein
MGEPDHRHIRNHPRRIEQREQPLRGEQRAQRADVAQTLRVAAPATPCALRDRDPRDHRRQQFGDDVSGHALQARAQVVERQQQRERDTDTDQQHQQGFAALAGEHAVEDLKHEQRGDEQQQVDEKGKARDVGSGREELEQWFHRLDGNFSRPTARS